MTSATTHGVRSRARTFLIVGAGLLAIDAGLFNILRMSGFGPITAKAVSTVVAVLVSYFANRRFTFGDRLLVSRHVRDGLVFLFLNTVAVGIVLAVLAVSHYLLGWHGPLADNISANVVGAFAATVFRFWAYGAFVFSVPELDRAAPVDLHEPAGQAA